MNAEFKVPRSLLITTAVDRLAVEARILDLHFEGWSVRRGSPNGDLGVAQGTLAVRFAGSTYPLKIVMSASYPHKLPQVLPDGWTPRPNPHLIGGGLCVMKESQWHSFMSVAFVVAKTALWLNKYEIYLDKRIWPGGEQHSHGPIYNLRKIWHEL
ncbi:hypothetical protein OG897_22070 [Streptomyces sp. NBC_00237]|uniref:hypothetical protein n=1 Tax=Streptomyces sp. NBC_00237 TaxID=2975687 RepID=UPI0022558C03|nr:hypothetical protein [Streptomyces sp. NBC_00237]MCX5204125.1 hypothetical protein [Streptomyces sp. NBC_00237]